MTLARFIAGDERRSWLDAMEAELAHLPERRLDWALGSLVASVKDRMARDWPFGLALGLLPGLAVVTAFFLTAATIPLLKLSGLSPSLALYLQVFAPLPFAYLLGRVRPIWPALWVGLAGFLVYQIMPALAWRTLIGPGMAFYWGPSLWPLGLPVPVALLTWLVGTRWGRTAARRRVARKANPPSP
jgi:hypothetical protein